MPDPLSEERLVKNEVAFRSLNESVQERIDEVQNIADEEGHSYKANLDNYPVQFYCECSDVNCRQRLGITLEKYKQIHERRNRFIVICGHETTEIERVVKIYGKYCVVEKFVLPPQS